MKALDRCAKLASMITGLSLVLILAACSTKSKPTVASAPAEAVNSEFESSATDARRLSDGANKLIEAMKKPGNSFHFAFSGQENVNDDYSKDKAPAPRVGPVLLQADFSPGEIDLTETRGSRKETSKARSGDDVAWAMANLKALGVMTSPNFAIALGSSVTTPPGADLVGAIPADKFIFDTSQATESQKKGLEAAELVLTTMKNCKGTAWIARDSGLLIKFNIDAEYQDKNQHAWKEHYEGEVTPK